MNKLVCKRSELPEWEDVFRQCGAVTKAESEPREPFQKAMYAIGRNWDRVQKVIKHVQAQVRKMLAPSDLYDAFLKEVEALNREYCQQDEQGEPVFKPNAQGQNTFQFTDANRATRDGMVEALKKRPAYATAIDEQETKEKDIGKFMEEPIEVELFTVPWSSMPERLSGPYLSRVAVMATDIPPDVADMMKNEDAPEPSESET